MGSISINSSIQKLHRKSMVIASENIPSGSKSLPFPVSSVLGRIDPGFLRLSHSQQSMQVCVGQAGEISVEKPQEESQSGSSNSNSSPSVGNSFWPKLIAIASDCHSQNVQLIWQQNKLILQATKNIFIGQQLFLWFSNELLVDILRIQPFLSPSCIRGRNCYTCSTCLHEFESPNLLKIHMALECGTLSMDILWARLTNLKTLSNSTFTIKNQNKNNSTFTNHTRSRISECENNVRSSISLSNSHPIHHSSSSHSHSHSRAFGRFSEALSHMPITASSTISTSSASYPRSIIRPSSILLNESTTPTTLLRIAPSSTLINNSISPIISSNQNPNLNPNTSSGQQNHSQNGNKILANPQGHLETLISNMGKAKNGHICLYCGKLYSRKYGLKIHIRTHTGYKPLQCKICSRPFGDPSNLNKHIRLHSDSNTPYRCGFCEKVLVRRRDLERHIRSRHTNSNSSNASAIIPIH